MFGDDLVFGSSLVINTIATIWFSFNLASFSKSDSDFCFRAPTSRQGNTGSLLPADAPVSYAKTVNQTRPSFFHKHLPVDSLATTTNSLFLLLSLAATATNKSPNPTYLQRCQSPLPGTSLVYHSTPTGNGEPPVANPRT